MDILLIVSAVVGILITLNVVGIFKNIFFPEFPIGSSKSELCGNKKCAFYKVENSEGSVNENALCTRNIKYFEERYRGRNACNKSIAYFGSSPSETISLIKQRRQNFFMSINSLASYVSIILIIYRIIRGS